MSIHKRLVARERVTSATSRGFTVLKLHDAKIIALSNIIDEVRTGIANNTAIWAFYGGDIHSGKMYADTDRKKLVRAAETYLKQLERKLQKLKLEKQLGFRQAQK